MDNLDHVRQYVQQGRDGEGVYRPLVLLLEVLLACYDRLTFIEEQLADRDRQ